MKIVNFKNTNQVHKLEKPNKKEVFLLILSVCLIIIAIVIVPTFFFSYTNNDLDTCLDISYCKEGTEINTQYGKVKIDKQTCLKYNWEWYEKNNSCFLKN